GSPATQGIFASDAPDQQIPVRRRDCSNPLIPQWQRGPRHLATQIDVPDALGAELLRWVAETADLGGQVGAYETAVPVADNASDFAKALGLAGRTPNDQRTASL